MRFFEALPYLAVIALFALCIVGAIEEEREWQDYAASHHCHAVGKREGEVTSTWSTSSNGNLSPGIGVESDQTIYACDAGEIRIR